MTVDCCRDADTSDSPSVARTAERAECTCSASGWCIGSVVVREHVLPRSSVQRGWHRPGHGKAAVITAGGRHHGVLGLSCKRVVRQIHALKAMSECREISGRIVHAVGLPSLSTSSVLTGVHVVSRSIAGVRTVVASVLVVGHARHCSSLEISRSPNNRRSHGLSCVVSNRPLLVLNVHWVVCMMDQTHVCNGKISAGAVLAEGEWSYRHCSLV